MARTKQVKTKEFTFAVGRRSRAVARVRLFKGQGESTINDKLVGIYFPGAVMRAVWNKPFELTETEQKYYVTARVVGGGKNGQVEAVMLAIAKALAKLDAVKFRGVLKKAGLLTRDARKKERRKVGTGGKARRAKQSPKR